MKHLSLSSRITILLGIAAVLLLGGAAMVMDSMVDAEISRRMDAALLSQAQTLASLARLGPNGLDMDMDNVRAPRTNLIAKQPVQFWSVHCANGSTVVSDPAAPNTPIDWAITAKAKPQFADIDNRQHILRAVWFTLDAGVMPTQTTSMAPSCSVLFMHSRDAMDDILTVIDDILLSIPFLAVLAVLLLSPTLVRRGLKPLRVLGDTMRDIGPQAPGQRLHATGPRELEPLVARFNEVLTRMDEGVARERQFAGALAHETRTHLTELRSLVEVEQRYPSKRPPDDVLGEIGHVVDELQNTVSGLLLLTRLEAGIEGMDPGNVRLDEVLTRQLHSVAKLLRQRRLDVDRTPIPFDTTLVADRALLDIVIGNLVNNAAAYAPHGSTIGIHYHTHALVIDNHAPDVDAGEVTRFGQRFWSKHHGIAGHAGLGLALAGAAADAMHLTLHFTLDTQQRLSATLSWPDDLEMK
ncbi:MAG TPA: ATP-binding protein [Oleiagrimonas sp.]|nr:ATP-binding protein [Oleiagrimonas sp.]